MKFSIISLLVVVSTVSAAAVPHLEKRVPSYSSNPSRRTTSFNTYYPRQASSINSTLSTINQNVLDLTTAIKGYSGGLLAAASISGKQSTLSTSLKSATTSIQGMQKLSSSDSKSLLQSIKILTPNIQGSIQALVGKKAEFTSAGLSGTVSSTLKTTKTDSDAFGMALVGIASDDIKPEATKSLQALDETLDQAAAAFAAWVWTVSGNQGTAAKESMLKWKVGCGRRFWYTSICGVVGI